VTNELTKENEDAKGFCTVANNTLFLSGARIVNPLTSVLLVSIIARSQGADGLGQYSLVLALFFTAAGLVSLGLDIPVTRAVATHKDRSADYLFVSSIVGLTAAAAGYVSMWIIVRVLNYPDEICTATNLLMWALFPTALTVFCEAVFMGHEKAKYVAVMSVAENVMKVVLGLLLFSAGHGLHALFVLILVLRFVACFAELTVFRFAIGPLHWHFSRSTFRELLRSMPVFSTNLVIGTAFGRIDIILLSKFCTMTEVGLYSAALRIFTLALVVPQAYMRAILPAMSVSAKQSFGALKRILMPSVKCMLVTAVAAALGLFIFADKLIVFVYGHDLLDAQHVLKILAFALVPGSISPVYAAALFATMNQRLDLIACISRIVGLVVLCIILIPLLGHIGAPLAFLGAALIFFSMEWKYVSMLGLPASLGRVAWRPICAGSIAWALAMLLKEASVFLVAPAMLISYVTVLLCLRTFSAVEGQVLTMWLSNAFPRRNKAVLADSGDN